MKKTLKGPSKLSYRLAEQRIEEFLNKFEKDFGHLRTSILINCLFIEGEENRNKVEVIGLQAGVCNNDIVKIHGETIANALQHQLEEEGDDDE